MDDTARAAPYQWEGLPEPGKEKEFEYTPAGIVIQVILMEYISNKNPYERAIYIASDHTASPLL